MPLSPGGRRSDCLDSAVRRVRRGRRKGFVCELGRRDRRSIAKLSAPSVAASLGAEGVSRARHTWAGVSKSWWKAEWRRPHRSRCHRGVQRSRCDRCRWTRSSGGDWREISCGRRIRPMRRAPWRGAGRRGEAPYNKGNGAAVKSGIAATEICLIGGRRPSAGEAVRLRAAGRDDPGNWRPRAATQASGSARQQPC